MKVKFPRQIYRKYLNLMNIHSVGAKLFYANGRTDRHTSMIKLIVIFHDFANTPVTKLLTDFLKFDVC
jgi:hypothetical protein